MSDTSTNRYTGPLLLAAMACTVIATSVGAYVAQSQANPVPVAQTISLVAPTAPAKPTITVDQAWAMVGPQVEASPWLSRADETAAWIDQTGDDAQQAAAAVSAKLRELEQLINEHWAGQVTVEALQSIAKGSAVFSPSPSVKAAALGLAYAVDNIDQWTVMLADQTDKLSAWIEGFTEPYERYALAYQAMQDDPTAEGMREWLTASQALLPHLAQAERLSEQVESKLGSVRDRLASIHTALGGADHWSVDWLATNVDEQVVVPSLAKLEQFTATAKTLQGQAAYDHALIASLPSKFDRYEIVD